MKVSVLVPVFNTEPSELERCISSLLCQRFEQYEIIIVDDGSVPCPQRDRLIASYSTNPIINCVRHEKNLGLPSARNTALRIAVGEFVVHVDSDDYWITDSVLKKLYETAIIDGCDVLRFNGQYSSGGKLGARLVPKIECVNKALNAESKLQVFRTIFLFFYRRVFVLDNDLFLCPDIHIGEDAVHVSGLLAATNKISSISDSFYAYSIDNKSMMRCHWKFFNFADENNSAKQVLNNLQPYPEIAKNYISYRYSFYMTKALLPRALSNLNAAELRELTGIYLRTLTDFNRSTGPSLVPGKTLRMLAWYSENRVYSILDAGVTTLIEKLYPTARMYYHFVDYRRLVRALKGLLKTATRRTGVLLPRSISWQRTDKNQEGFTDYNLVQPALTKVSPKPGLSVMLRVKNEESGIRQCIESIIGLCDELVVIDNNSTDETAAIINLLAENHTDGSKIKLHHYPFLVAKCGSEHDSTPESSVHSLAYYYNWCLDRCKFKAVLKWDADMVMSSSHDKRKIFSGLVEKIVNSNLIMAIGLATQSYYATDIDTGILATSEKHTEVRLFSNHKKVYFVKATNFEKISFFAPIRLLFNEDVFSYEIKRLDEDEFDHWSSVSFSTKRKVQEYRSFQRLKKFGVESYDDEYLQVKLSKL